ncbi:MAG: transcriptional repressor [Planctomycetota bacterium]|nr:MAG: transcriptional repressor [Planctomycetota bacterium]
MNKQEGLVFFQKFFQDHNLRFTRSREKIVEWILEHREHFTAEDLQKWALLNNLKVSRATIYRTLSLLTEKKLLVRRDFSQNQSHYELIWGSEPHEHMICMHCGTITEFKNPKIEKLLLQEAAKNEFSTHFHSIKIYGVCKDCREEKSSKT